MSYTKPLTDAERDRLRKIGSGDNPKSVVVVLGGSAIGKAAQFTRVGLTGGKR